AIFCGRNSDDELRYRRGVARRRRGRRAVRPLGPCFPRDPSPQRADELGLAVFPAAIQSLQRYDDLRYHPHLASNSRQGERQILTTRACLLATAAALSLSDPISAQHAAAPS